ncbi:MAG: Antidote-toxin recognition MazE, bacterial antitoxin [Candidatus Parcubacteria bacterium]|jgi:antitoxin component of MazEF toxin-antitoxin module
MIQKVLKVGSSVAVTIPKKSLPELGLRPGDAVNVDVDPASATVLIRPVCKESARARKITSLALNFIERYRKDLEALARK